MGFLFVVILGNFSRVFISFNRVFVLVCVRLMVFLIGMEREFVILVIWFNGVLIKVIGV